ncbi:C39 family peptidase [Paenibacillus sp.]|uniref:C39 family peptidase n=1 Tax=Paenibacillus sp. TaxID=58172 RepID=UPI0028AEC14D|nr:C39 family peptidase [Paenibacillus sp.]
MECPVSVTNYQRIHIQWEAGVASPSSACGPATMAALTEYWNTQLRMDFIRGKGHFHSKAAHINYIYSHHGGTPLGMSVRRFTKGLKDYIHSSLLPKGKHKLSITTFNDFNGYKAEIDAGRPVAVKFDKWFKFQWRGKFAYDYHWVLGIGYEVPDNGDRPILIVQDNGVRYKDGEIALGKERRIPYFINKDIITMVGMNIVEPLN